MIDIFRGIFGIDLFTNAAFIFTHWPKDQYSVDRRKTAGVTEEMRKSEINRQIK